MSRPRKTMNATAQRILDAADELLCQRGYDAVSMQEVATKAGANKSAVFYHFHSKTDLMEKVLERNFNSHLVNLSEVAQKIKGGSRRKRFHTIIDMYLDYMESHPVYPRLIQLQLADKEGMHDLLIRSMAPFIKFLDAIMGDLAPEKQGPTSANHLHLSIAGFIANFYLYEPVIGKLWGKDPQDKAVRTERREHVHWMIDAMIDKLEKDLRQRKKDAKK